MEQTFFITVSLLFLIILFLLYKNRTTTQKLNNSLNKLENLQKTAKLGFWEFKIKENQLYWSQEIFHIFELDKNFFKPSYEKFLDTIHPEDRERVQKTYENSLITKMPYEIIHRLLFKDGSIKYVLEQCDTTYDNNGNPIVSYGTVLDITKQKLYEEELHLFKQIVETIDVGISVGDAHKKSFPLIYVNPAFEKITGYSKNEILNKNCNILQRDDRNQESIKTIKNSLKDIESCEVELRNYKKDDTLFWNLLSLTPFLEEHKLKYYIGVQHDITKQKTLYEQLKNLIDLQNNIILLTNGKEITFVNKKFLEFFNYSSLKEFKKEYKCVCELFIEHKKFFSLKKVDEDQSWLEEIQKLPEPERIIGALNKDFEINAFAVHVNDFDAHMQVVSLTDISHTLLKQILLEEKTIHDKLTNAFNREYFELNYQTWIKNAKNNTKELAIAFLDIDHFKSVNDTHGHDIGDKVLITLVDTINRYSRTNDILIRWGGEEFIFILQVNSKETLEKILNNIRIFIQNKSIEQVGNITCSIGASLYMNSENIHSTIKRADEAVYRAKRNGRNRVEINI